MKPTVSLARPQDVAWLLASYARQAQARMTQHERPALAAVRTALEDALGLTFEGAKGEHFFRSSLVQTLFYGMFSAWVLQSKPPAPPPHFDWRHTANDLHVPLLRHLFHAVTDPDHVLALGLTDVLDATGAALNRVDRATFVADFDAGRAVQDFYEPFLQAFDPALRKELGVWYTPSEIVQYMVTRVDTVLREELDVQDGLADPRVSVLDPGCGTGAYLLEVLRHIAATLCAKGENARASNALKQAAMERLFGFEILPAPFLIAHLQLGLLLHHLGAPLSEQHHERVGIYLTNALTGWEPPQAPKDRLLHPHRANACDAPILVILGNPPYNAFPGVCPNQEQHLVQPYKEGLIGVWGMKKFNLDDLYVRFFRLAERHVAAQRHPAVVCYISNFSYLHEPSFVVMRQRLLQGFSHLWFDCLNGDSRQTGKRTPDGQPDPSVFSTAGNPAGIRKGTAISVLVRHEAPKPQPLVRFRQLWGANKRAALLQSLEVADFNAQYDIVQPDQPNRFSFRPLSVASPYLTWPRLIDLCAAAPHNGLMEKRRGALLDIDRTALEHRMQQYYDARVDGATLQALHPGLTTDAAGFEAHDVRLKILRAESYQPERICRYAFRPLDMRWCYYSDVSPLWNRARPALRAQCRDDNAFLLSRPTGVATPEGVPLAFTRTLGENDLLRGHAYYFPIFMYPTYGKRSQRQPQQTAMATPDQVSPCQPQANLSPTARAYLTALGLRDIDACVTTAGLIWMHSLAIGFTPAYLAENADGIRSDWLRLPLPQCPSRLLASAALGRQVATLLNMDQPVCGVTSGAIRPELQSIAVLTQVGGGIWHTDTGGLTVSAGWGYPHHGATMPGKGKVVTRAYTPEEDAALHASAQKLRLTIEHIKHVLGTNTYDIYVNDTAYWTNIPVNIWGYTIGGYPVLKKWLSYREHHVLGRSLTRDEAHDVSHIARRLAAILLLTPALEANYDGIKTAAYVWPPASL